MKNRITGSQIAVVDNRSKTFIEDGEKWYSVCDSHGNLVGHETRKLAEYHAVVPEWCEDCSAMMHERNKERLTLEITCGDCANVYEVTEIRDGLFSSDATFCARCDSGKTAVTGERNSE